MSVTIWFTAAAKNDFGWTLEDANGILHDADDDDNLPPSATREVIFKHSIWGQKSETAQKKTPPLKNTVTILTGSDETGHLEDVVNKDEPDRKLPPSSLSKNTGRNQPFSYTGNVLSAQKKQHGDGDKSKWEVCKGNRASPHQDLQSKLDNDCHTLRVLKRYGDKHDTNTRKILYFSEGFNEKCVASDLNLRPGTVSDRMYSYVSHYCRETTTRSTCTAYIRSNSEILSKSGLTPSSSRRLRTKSNYEQGSHSDKSLSSCRPFQTDFNYSVTAFSSTTPTLLRTFSRNDNCVLLDDSDSGVTPNSFRPISNHDHITYLLEKAERYSLSREQLLESIGEFIKSMGVIDARLNQLDVETKSMMLEADAIRGSFCTLDCDIDKIKTSLEELQDEISDVQYLDDLIDMLESQLQSIYVKMIPIEQLQSI